MFLSSFYLALLKGSLYLFISLSIDAFIKKKQLYFCINLIFHLFVDLSL